MTHRPRSSPGLTLEQLEDRTTPAGSTIPAGEFNWMQFSPTGELAQLVWEGQTLVYRTRVANASGSGSASILLNTICVGRCAITASSSTYRRTCPSCWSTLSSFITA